ncbi:glucose-6-phosphate 1-dehydrogenase [Petrotoga miotherma DSM 10691]|uniref:Glucose-6-phosphate 1-dehydrogenase n=2 Tax=Petrotoga TaxID=28236 RepID=A0A2K1P7L6_9BACT|nr:MULTISPECIES: glucose-6-phosphate dehydrogenase [Petrotoga]MDN5345815.1 glucose-6-phosphate 1-dehydrogenase [Petrotoga sp.]PNR98707.1 glucose-6-phosphate 1-dehydrogenase [Petrotoga miotherma DSM 10691]POZ92340.1 glucose-6-phosphate dehydrogenase [Petrotoga halophila DSM 16923]
MEQITKHLSRKNICEEIKPGASSLIIFGASGDLTFRKLIPSIYTLFKKNLLPNEFFLLGIARSKFTDEEYRQEIKNRLLQENEDSYIISRFVEKVFYTSGFYDDDTLYLELKNKLNYLDKLFNTQENHLFYLSTPPNVYLEIIKRLGKFNLTKESENSYSRIIIEKPFGSNFNTSKELDEELHKYLNETQIYRIDHYLGKETVQNIMMLRFANIVFEPIWNYKYIDNVQITVAETLGVEHRAGYFEQAGLLRDMFQNHMMQLLTLVAMEPPASLEDTSVRDEKTKLLKTIRPFEKDKIDEYFVRGQYIDGMINGKEVSAYTEEKNVNPNSFVETFVAAKFLIDNWRWSGVPFYLRAGKRLKRKVTEIVIIFKDVPHSIFAKNDITLEKNALILNIQPDEGFSLKIQAKQPGSKLCLNTLTMDFNYDEFFKFKGPDAYERLLLDAMLGDQTLFVRSDAMEISWKIFTPVLEKWEEEKHNGLRLYKAGTWGPKESFELLAKDNRSWRNLDFESEDLYASKVF